MLDAFVWFVKEREAIRVKKESGEPKPWTNDLTLQQYRFCNIRRQDDKVSRWIFDNWIQPYEFHPLIVEAIVVARMINWPDTLAEIGFPDESQDWTEYAGRIRARINRGEKTWTGAYMITAEHDGTLKEVSVCRTVAAVKNLTLINHCYKAWMELQRLPRIGSFMAAQFVADLKRTHVLGRAPDAWDFCAPGPGSQRGLNYVLNTPNKEWKQSEFNMEVNKLQGYMPFLLDAQNTQNCLCEFAKYVRGSSRSTYNGTN